MCVEFTAEKTELNSLVTSALGDEPKELEDAWETDEDAEVEGEVSLDQAVRHLVMGEPLNKNAGSQHGDGVDVAFRPP
jgi:hypothetical protein